MKIRENHQSVLLHTKRGAYVWMYVRKSTKNWSRYQALKSMCPQGQAVGVSWTWCVVLCEGFTHMHVSNCSPTYCMNTYVARIYAQGKILFKFKQSWFYFTYPICTDHSALSLGQNENLNIVFFSLIGYLHTSTVVQKSKKLVVTA